MEIIDNINRLLGDNLKQSLTAGAKLKIAASCFSIYAFEALKTELEKIELLEFIFTTPTFVPGEATDKVKKERREFHIPRLERERGFYGSPFQFEVDVGNSRGAFVLSRSMEFLGPDFAPTGAPPAPSHEPSPAHP